MKYRKALIIGLNYAGTPHELRGCVNDATDWYSFLNEQHFDLTMLTEKSATREAILIEIESLVAALKPGDTGVITYSGHGTWVPDVDGDEPDARDEALCPYDMTDDGKNLIIDDELHVIFNKIPDGVTMVCLTDCCHSGTVFRFVNSNPIENGNYSKPRFLPPSHFIKDPALYRRMERAYTPGGRRSGSNSPLPNIVHISACRDTEYAADAFINDRFNGAYTYYCLQAFQAQLLAGGTYLDVWRQLRTHLPSHAYPQSPALNAVSALKQKQIFA